MMQIAESGIAKKQSKPTGKKVDKRTSIHMEEKKISSPISKTELGKKHSCFQCSGKFYDMGKEKAVCPKCGADQANKPVSKQRIPVKARQEFEVSDSEFDDELILDKTNNLDEDDDTILEEEDN